MPALTDKKSLSNEDFKSFNEYYYLCCKLNIYKDDGTALREIIKAAGKTGSLHKTD